MTTLPPPKVNTDDDTTQQKAYTDDDTTSQKVNTDDDTTATEGEHHQENHIHIKVNPAGEWNPIHVNEAG